MKKTIVASSIALALSVADAGAAQAAPAYLPYTFTGSNFTMISPSSTGAAYGGTNDVSGSWDGTVYTSCSDPGAQCDFQGGTISSSFKSNMTLSSPTKFSGFNWTAHDIEVFGPGTYTFTETNGAKQTMKVGAGQVGAHMLFDWGLATKDIGVVDVFNVDRVQPGIFETGGTVTSDPWSGKAGTVWGLESAGGQVMVNGPFQGFKATFNVFNGHYVALSFTGSNFTMISPSSTGAAYGGTNDVSGSWDGTVYTSCSDPGAQCDFQGGTISSSFKSNMTLSSPTKFSGFNWTAHDIEVFGPGTYTFTETNGAKQTMKVGAGQVGAHMLFDWGLATKDIGVVDVFNLNQSQPGIFETGGTVTSDPWSGVAGTTWRLESSGGQGMVNGPFIDFKATFNLTDGHGPASGTSVPSSPANVTLSEPSTKLNNGGCAIDPNPVAPGNGGAWLIVGGFIAGLGIIRRKRRQPPTRREA